MNTPLKLWCAAWAAFIAAASLISIQGGFFVLGIGLLASCIAKALADSK